MDLPLRCSIFILLAFFLAFVPVTITGHGGALRRQKREWILAPRNLQEGMDYTHNDFIAKIRSDKESTQKISYFLTGKGVDQDPKGRFSVNRDNGNVKVHSILDREEHPKYDLVGVARYANGTRAENDIALLIRVIDINDCTPVIKAQQVGNVSEHSKSGTVVMKVIATDDDDPLAGDHAKISYRIDPRSNVGDMFNINSRTGEVTVAKNSLDRETKDTYKLIILASDMDGKAEGNIKGNTGTGEIEIKLTDINDNIPTLEKETYEAGIEENIFGAEVSRIKALDLDLVQTDSWFALYEIVSGNEGGYFEIQTDEKTNEGVITIKKALDYEEIKSLSLSVRVKNRAEYNFGSSMSMTGASSKLYPVKINVINQKEGAQFQPSVKVVTVSEGMTSSSMSQVIATYPAIDSDTLKTATNVRYAKLDDKDNWLTIDEKTAEIRWNKYPDRESKFLVNGTYYAKIISISNDNPSKTATGTIAIQVEDYNDHCPTLTSTTQNICFGYNVIYVTAHDKDMFPNAAPFDFSVIQGDSKDKWTVEPFNETTVILRSQEKLWPGRYIVSLKVKDQQGKSCADLQMTVVMVCTCDKETKSCLSRSTESVTFGAGGILLMLLGLLLLLLIPLLMLNCLCGSTARDFKDIPFEAKQHLISYHTEGQGEDKEMPLVKVPRNVNSGSINVSTQKRFPELGVEMGDRGTLKREINRNTVDYRDHFGFGGTGSMFRKTIHISKDGSAAFDGIALPARYLEQYYSLRLREASQQNQEEDTEVNFNHEGQGSLAGSVGCCSILENDDDDFAFLDDLGPKFKTLAEICLGTTSEESSAYIGVPNQSDQTVTSDRPSASNHTHVHTHTETTRDRDHTNINTLNISNKKSSTAVRKEQITESPGCTATLSKLQEKVVIPNPTLLIQQPAMYYTANPIYVVETQPQMVLVSGGTQQVVGQVAQPGFSQGFLQVGGLQSSQGVVLVEDQVVLNRASGQVVQGPSQGIVSESTQAFLAENGSLGGKHSKDYKQSSGHIAQRSSEADIQVGVKGVQVKQFSAGSCSSAGSKEDFALTTPKFQGSQSVVVQHKKVSVTERNIK